MRQQVLSLLVSNHFGVLNRVTSIFSRRTCNIVSLTVAETLNPEISRITILIEADLDMGLQLEKILQKQEDVIKAEIFPVTELISRELLLIKIKYDNLYLLENRLDELKQQCSPKVIDRTESTVTILVSSERSRINQFILDMRDFNIIELCRTGVASLNKGAGTLYDME
ncbi:MAG: acetolactate synthase small subunit [Oscillospiraceae bacterium]|jgi:acetolactate synthase-1/3 small subunit|nr:acetolactate synthase small subunit [Oscillospiraceae bacterium]